MKGCAANRVDAPLQTSHNGEASHTTVRMLTPKLQHRRYGSRTTRFDKYQFNRSLHQLNLVSFKVRLANSGFEPPYRIGNDLTFSPSLVVRPPLYSAARYSNYYDFC